MNGKSLMIGLMLSCVMPLGGNRAEAGKIPLRADVSGSYVNTQSDINGDGQKGAVSSGGFKGTLGSGTFQGVSEFVFSGQGTCPNGNPGFIFTLLPGTWPRVSRLDSTGELIFNELTSQTICFDPVTQIQFFTGTDICTGGTGRFEGATGTATFSGTAKTLFDDAAGNFFGELSLTYDETIITP